MDCTWNDAELPIPTLTIYPVKKVKFNILELKKLLQNAVDFYECQTNFKESGNLCSKLIARRKNSFRHFKGFQHMCKTRVSLNRLNKINISNVLQNYIGLLPESAFTLELPPKTNLNYVLLRIIAYYKVLERICECCKSAVTYFVRILRNNFFVEILSLFLSVLSKIWYDGNIIAKFTANFYSELKQYVTCMPNNKIKHRYDDIKFPDVLNVNILNESKEKVVENKTEDHIETEKYINKAEIMKSNSMSIRNDISQSTFLKRANHSVVDLGEVISRDLLLPVFDICKINEIKDIQTFLKDETLKREKSKEFFTKNISNEKWLKIKKNIYFNIKCGNNVNAIKIFKNNFHKSK